jgi:hypothetical protein
MGGFYVLRKISKIKILSFSILTACVPPQPFDCPSSPEIEKTSIKEITQLKQELTYCEEAKLKLSTECNPYSGNWQECPDWVYEKWVTPCDISWDE